MKLAIAALGTALVMATGASAMIGPYERAVEHPNVVSQLFTTGEGSVERADTRSTSPEADWNEGNAKKVTQFTNNSDASGHFGVDAR